MSSRCHKHQRQVHKARWWIRLVCLFLMKRLFCCSTDVAVTTRCEVFRLCTLAASWQFGLWEEGVSETFPRPRGSTFLLTRLRDEGWFKDELRREYAGQDGDCCVSHALEQIGQFAEGIFLERRCLRLVTFLWEADFVLHLENPESEISSVMTPAWCDFIRITGHYRSTLCGDDLVAAKTLKRSSPVAMVTSWP